MPDVFRWRKEQLQQTVHGTLAVQCEYKVGVRDGNEVAYSLYLERREIAASSLSYVADGSYMQDKAQVIDWCLQQYVRQLKEDGYEPEDEPWPLVLAVIDPETDQWHEYDVAAEFAPRFHVTPRGH